ncbi:hypothetical protein [Pseudomonas bohemica]|uniref:hypothetical protein n=1 Tax=Pseudomonas bohemica TaxID=2044872 RepID=UPI0018FEB031|nr:hypothetical protein [Pseudomonas bohemica]
MKNAFKQPLFVIGLPLMIFGFASGVIGWWLKHSFAYMAPGLFIAGLIFVVIGWIQRD